MRQLTQREISNIRNHPNQQSWNMISSGYALSEDFIREFQDLVDWCWVSCNQKLSEEFICEFQDKVDWIWISCSQALSENFIREFQDRVDWNRISHYQVLSEEFMREFRDKVDWNRVAYSQALSEAFIREFQNRFCALDVNVLRRHVTYGEIMSYDPCPGGVDRYLEHTTKEEQISWNTLLERHSYKYDIRWLHNKRTHSFVK